MPLLCSSGMERKELRDGANLFSKHKNMPLLKSCVCGGDDIRITETYTLGDISICAKIECKNCGREIKRRTYKKAVKTWNKSMGGGVKQ